MYLGERGGRLYELLLMKTKEVDRMLTFEEVLKDDRLPHPNDYAYYFGSFSEAAKSACSELHLDVPGKLRKRGPIKPLDPVQQAKYQKMLEDSLAPMRFLKKQELEMRRKALMRNGKTEAAAAVAAEIAKMTEADEARAMEIDEMMKATKKAEIVEVKEEKGMSMEGVQLNRELLLLDIGAVAKGDRRLPDLKSMGNLGGRLKYSMRTYVNVIGDGDIEVTKQAILDFVWMKEDEDGVLHGRRGRRPKGATPKKAVKVESEVKEAQVSEPESEVAAEKAEKPVEEAVGMNEVAEELAEPAEESSPRLVEEPSKPVVVEVQIKLVITINGAECKVEIVQ